MGLEIPRAEAVRNCAPWHKRSAQHLQKEGHLCRTMSVRNSVSLSHFPLYQPESAPGTSCVARSTSALYWSQSAVERTTPPLSTARQYIPHAPIRNPHRKERGCFFRISFLSIGKSRPVYITGLREGELATSPRLQRQTELARSRQCYPLLKYVEFLHFNFFEKPSVNKAHCFSSNKGAAILRS